VAFNPPATQLATGCHDGTVRIWDVAKGQQLKQINAHTTPAVAPVYCVAWTPNGKQIVSGSLDKSLKLWDATSGSLVREFKAYKEKEFEKGHRDGVFCLAISPDGKLLASGSSDHAVKLWDVASGAVLADFINPNLKAVAGASSGTGAHPGWIYSLRFTPDGRTLITAGNAPRNQGYLALWNVAERKMLLGEELATGPIYGLAVSPDAGHVALACGPRERQAAEGNGYVVKIADVAK
jgi:WD40 repeat protein